MALTFSKGATFTSQKKTQQILTIVLGIVVFVTAFFIWQGVFKKPAVPTEDISVIGGPKLVEINFGILDREGLFERLALPPPPLVLPTTIGRENPFAPL